MVVAISLNSITSSNGTQFRFLHGSSRVFSEESSGFSRCVWSIVEFRVDFRECLCDESFRETDKCVREVSVRGFETEEDTLRGNGCLECGIHLVDEAVVRIVRVVDHVFHGIRLNFGILRVTEFLAFDRRVDHVDSQSVLASSCYDDVLGRVVIRAGRAERSRIVVELIRTDAHLTSGRDDLVLAVLAVVS